MSSSPCNINPRIGYIASNLGDAQILQLIPVINHSRHTARLAMSYKWAKLQRITTNESLYRLLHCRAAAVPVRKCWRMCNGHF